MRRILVAVAGGLALFALAATRLGPDRFPSPYNSDTAIPVLMADDDGWDVFRAYYFGQDRFGSWPFLLARALRGPWMPQWSPGALHVWLCAWIAAGAALAGALLPRRWGLAAFAWFLVVLLHPGVQSVVFTPQPYAWQTAAILATWWAMRRSLVLALPCAFLAVWVSTTSAPLLLVIAVVERLGGGRMKTGVFAVVLAGACELSMRVLYWLYTERTIGHAHVTRLSLDTEFLGQNLRRVTGAIWDDGPGWLVLAGLAAGALAAVRLRRRTDRRDADVLVLGSAAVAVTYAVIVVAVDHVRLNGYAPRYFTPVYAFAAWAAVLAAGEELDRLLERRGVTRAGLVVVPLAVLAAALAVSSSPADPRFVGWQAVAERVARERPHAVLLGDYWKVYALAGLQGEGRSTPVPFEHQYQRTPFWRSEYRNAEEVVLVGSPGDAHFPPPFRVAQFGRTLTLVEPLWFESGGLRFAVFR